jgi:hypothetical protein
MTSLPESRSATMSSEFVFVGNALLAAWRTRSASRARIASLSSLASTPVSSDARADVPADLVLAVDEQPDELEVGGCR